MSPADTVYEDLSGVELIEVIKEGPGGATTATGISFTPSADFDTAPVTVAAALLELAQRIKALEP